MTYLELYNKYIEYWHKARRMRKGNLIQKLCASPYRKQRDSYINKVFDAIKGEVELYNLNDKGNPEIVVSLTSYPRRIKNIHLTIKSILTQDMLPGKIVLWLSNEQFPNQLKDLPKPLTELMSYGLEISFFDELGIRPHNKYFHAFKRYGDKIIITVDDDTVYAPNTISRLWEAHTEFPNAVCTNRMRKIRFDRKNSYLRYKKWSRPVFKKPTQSMFFTALGYSGVLYPPGSYSDVFFDTELILELSPMADDLWLKACQIATGVPVVVPEGEFASPLDIPETQSTSLRNTNDGESKNDEQWGKLDRHFGLKNILLNLKNKDNMI